MAQQQAGMATLKEIDQRLKSVRNIGKITKVGIDAMSVITQVWADKASLERRDQEMRDGAAGLDCFTMGRGDRVQKRESWTYRRTVGTCGRREIIWDAHKHKYNMLTLSSR